MSLINVPNIFCDTKCLQNKEIKELYDNYEFVKQQLQDEVNSSKNYYNVPFMDKNITDKFNISIENVDNKIELYKGNISNSNKNLELYHLYYDINNTLLSSFNVNTTNTLTNERNSYYENESSTSKTGYNSILKYLYILLIISFVIFLYLVKTVLTVFTIILLFLFFIIFPFLCYIILKSLHSVFLK
jgi:hypothetical protein